ncbi:spermidine synthase [Streptomyces laurentii]|uniref:Spermidine synthase n=1 Tax=Streptomyces laurentii TaxID=39478 RepID=A0A160NY25_STRLU|nr:spermidine synthase [Streptomyces laurentii]
MRAFLADDQPHAPASHPASPRTWASPSRRPIEAEGGIGVLGCDDKGLIQVLRTAPAGAGDHAGAASTADRLRLPGDLSHDRAGAANRSSMFHRSCWLGSSIMREIALVSSLLL